MVHIGFEIESNCTHIKIFLSTLLTEVLIILTVEVLSYSIVMPFGKYNVERPVQIPTFLQYVGTISKGVEGKTKFQVELIWLPGKFNNVTLQTHAFRYICSENHPLYNEIIEYSKELVSRGAVPKLQIVITSILDKQIEVLEDTKGKCEWKQLGANAFKVTNL